MGCIRLLALSWRANTFLRLQTHLPHVIQGELVDLGRQARQWIKTASTPPEYLAHLGTPGVLCQCFPSRRSIKVVASPERHFAVWHGAQVSASVRYMNMAQWMSSDEYDESAAVSLVAWLLSPCNLELPPPRQVFVG